MNKGSPILDQLKQDRSNCRRFAREIEQALHYLHWMDDDLDIQYAVDYAEMLPYILPESERGSGLLLFADVESTDSEKRRRIIEHQQLLLQKLFDDVQTKLILLPPYAIELDTLWESWNFRRTREVLQRMVRADVQLSRMIQKPEFHAFLDFSEKLSREEISPDSREYQHWVEQLEATIPEVIFTLNPPEQNPQKRIRQLLEETLIDLEDVNDFPPLQIQSDNELIRGVKSYLMAERGHNPDFESSTYLDAVAIDVVVRMNIALSAPSGRAKTRFVLISRSATMKRAMSSELAKYLGQNQTLETKYLICHPRVIGLLKGVHHLGEVEREEVRNDLLALYDKAMFILKTVRSSQSMDQLPVEVRPQVEEALRDLRNSWLFTEIASLGTEEFSEDIAKIVDREVFRRVAEVLRTPENWRDLVKKTIDTMTKKLEDTYAILGVYIPSTSSGKSHLLEMTRFRREYNHKSVLRASSQLMPYTIQFYSQGAVERIARAFDVQAEGDSIEIPLDKLKQMSWQQLVQAFKEDFVASDAIGSAWDFERLLLIAFISGVLNSWELAEACTQLAIERVEKLSNKTLIHEAYFFAAICKRKAKPSLGNYLDAIQDIENAIQLKKERQLLRSSSGPKHEDPRYLKEKATQILACYLYFTDEDRKRANLRIPRVEDGLRFLDEAEEIVRRDDMDDKRLLIQIINNRLTYFNEFPLGADKTSLLQQLDELEAIQEKFSDEPPHDFPAGLLDTLAYGRWRFSTERSDQLVDRITRDFQIALDSSETTPKEHERIRQHYEEFRRDSGKVIQVD